MDKSMKCAGAHLTTDMVCRKGQVVEQFACRDIETGEFYRFDRLHNERYAVFDAEYQPTWFTRATVSTIRKNLPDPDDMYLGVPMSRLVWVRFSLSESPETL
jgi:hypothetical protein